QHISEFQRHIGARMGPQGFDIEVPPETRRALLRMGASTEFGARDLKRTLHRHLIEPLAALVTSGVIEPGASLRLLYSEQADRLFLQTGAGEVIADDGY
ncbi:MAG: ATPase, partial [Acidobacteriales bacterium]